MKPYCYMPLEGTLVQNAAVGDRRLAWHFSQLSTLPRFLLDRGEVDVVGITLIRIGSRLATGAFQ